MATSQKLTEHFLTCTICTEVFGNPCTLVCYHTFCRKCVVNYTKTRPEAMTAKSLMCPFCKMMTKVSAPERPVEEWTDDIKPSFVIQGLLDSFGPGAKDTTYCLSCRKEGETTPATAWCPVCDDALCDKCTRQHNSSPATRHHGVTDFIGEDKVVNRRKVMCKEHKGENIKFICRDCKKAVCPICCTLYHRKCHSVITIESDPEMLIIKEELTNTKGNLYRRKAEMQLEMEKKKSKLNDEITRYSQMETDIKSTSIKAIEEIKQKEETLLNQLKEMSAKHTGHLKADIESDEMSVQMYQQQAGLIEQILLSECDMDVYEMYQGCEVGDGETVGDAGLKKSGRIAKINLRQDMEKLTRALDDLQLGEIDVQYESELDLKLTPELQDTIKVRVPSDSGNAYPVDMTVLVVNRTDTVVVTDNNNKSVKSFYTRNKKQGHSKLSLISKPWGVTRMKHNQVAVTLPDTRQIVTVEVNPDLELLSTVTTSKQYWGITSPTPSTLAAGSQSPPCVDILDMSGHMLRSITPVHHGNNILRYPNFLSTTGTGNILVSDSGTACVMCLTPGGDVVFTYSPTGDTLTVPRGISSTSTGDILVTYDALDRVIHLTESGQFVRNILTSRDGVWYPYGLCISEQQIYVCHVMTREIKVFKFG
ncbi:E3 ubiquitin-protein ligase Midline-1-like [Haliotis rufescens]|uniref:E3 ubiquitin-protein ligase Midline-1-like n=1 Tax=Haliotis rufescens TaxID=6454 RepID=UPI00201F8333|nr:E3 ubiquitin-protein ligase Midline-1-like [Haliotis rufescens]